MFGSPSRKPLDLKLVTPSTRSSTSSFDYDDEGDSPYRLSVSSVVARKLSFSGGSGGSPRNSTIGSTWSTEMSCLRQSGTTFEAVVCLRRIQQLLMGIDRNDRLKFCKSDFENAKNSLRRIPHVWSDVLSREVALIMSTYFNHSPFRHLPTSVIQEILLWLPIDEFAPIPAVCWEWHDLGTGDEVWQTFYRYKFLRYNPDTMPAKRSGYMASFKARLSDPQIGDKVEVAWRGKFRLEAMDVYQGLAWWVAEVVDKHQAQGKYKIRYPGWESRWDEWVTRSRLRWAVDSNALNQILPGSVVELWCCGANVPGAWLESRVKKVRAGRYCMNKVLSSGALWVERDRLRLVKHPVDADTRSGSPTRRSLLSMLPESFSSRLSSSGPSSGGSCTTM